MRAAFVAGREKSSHSPGHPGGTFDNPKIFRTEVGQCRIATHRGEKFRSNKAFVGGVELKHIHTTEGVGVIIHQPMLGDEAWAISKPLCQIVADLFVLAPAYAVETKVNDLNVVYTIPFGKSLRVPKSVAQRDSTPALRGS